MSDIERDVQDREYWRQIEPILGMNLSGWTYRHSALFTSDHGSFTLPGAIAENLLKYKETL